MENTPVVIDNISKRSILLATVLGDGCLYNSSPSQHNLMGYITIEHGYKQKDYVEFKAELLSLITGKIIKCKSTKGYVKATDKIYDKYKLQFGWKRMRAWRNFCYPNKVKSHKKLLKFIKHPKLALALWLMDDGTVMTGRVRRNDPSSPRVASGFILYLGEIYREDAFEIQWWFEKTFKVKPKLSWQKHKYKGTIRSYPHLSFNVQDSLYLYKHIRDIVQSIPSMANKFLKLENRYNRSDLLQPQTLPIIDSASDDIVHILLNKINNLR